MTKAGWMVDVSMNPGWFLLMLVTGLIGIWLLTALFVWMGEAVARSGVQRPSKRPMPHTEMAADGTWEPTITIDCMAHDGGKVIIERRTGSLVSQCKECL